jgi:methionyl-tRNA synthetase
VATTYLTVAIPYVNADPHLGYAYELVAADVYARARRLAGDDVRFLGGTDDYSLKNVLAADAAGVPTRKFVDAHAERFAALAVPLELSFDDFIRTSADPRHRPAVERLWRACAAKGDLYRRSYEGDYCVGCEQFYTAAELLTDDAGHRYCPEHVTPVERVAEENWFFRLSAYQDHLDGLISSGELEIHPRQYRDEVLAFVRGGLADISVSRSIRRARGWGIGVPDAIPGHRPDPGDQVIYVWFDALTNYLSALGFGDPDSVAHRRWWLDADRRVHVVGKGIVRFHAVYWPAFLASAGQPAPTRIEVHPYLTVDGAKLSKSADVATLGPTEVVERYRTDALRWWFVREVAATADTDFTAARLTARWNDDLANGAGNVANRIVALVRRRPGGCLAVASAAPIDGLEHLATDVLGALSGFDLRGGARLITDAVDALNRDLDATQPWKLAAQAATDDALAQRRIDVLLARQLASARAIASALAPIVPGTSAALVEQLGAGGEVGDARPVVARLEAPADAPIPV